MTTRGSEGGLLLRPGLPEGLQLEGGAGAPPARDDRSHAQLIPPSVHVASKTVMSLEFRLGSRFLSPCLPPPEQERERQSIP